MSSSRSRSRSASGNRKIDHGLEAGLAHGAGGVAGASEYRASGRGGWGNMHAANGEDDDRERLRKLDEEDDRVRHSYEERQGPDTYDSAGRGELLLPLLVSRARSNPELTPLLPLPRRSWKHSSSSSSTFYLDRRL
jgi:hypothetical protein